MIELNNFYIGESVKFIKENIPNDFVDLTITSPPYDDLRKYKGFIFDYKSMLDELYRVTKQGGVIVWVVGDKTDKGSETLTSFQHALYAKEIGFNVHDTMIYQKNGGVKAGSLKAYSQSFEYMFVLVKGKIKTFNLIKDKKNSCAGEIKKRINKRKEDGHIDRNEGEYTIPEFSTRDNIWIINVGANKSTKDKIAFNHPAIFPEQLVQDHIISWSNEGDIVFDPMCGSGTVCKQAFLHNRKFIGIDMSEEYINGICIPRLKEYGWNKELHI